jgi:hypothetical protein
MPNNRESLSRPGNSTEDQKSVTKRKRKAIAGAFLLPADRRRLTKEFQIYASKLFQAVQLKLGTQDARRIFKQATKPPALGKQPNLRLNRRLLEIYDAMQPASIGEVARVFTGCTKETIGKRLRRLLKAREKEKSPRPPPRGMLGGLFPDI